MENFPFYYDFKFSIRKKKIDEKIKKMASIDWNDETIVIKDNKGQKIHLFNDDQYRSAMLENLNMLRKNRQFCDVILQVMTIV